MTPRLLQPVNSLRIFLILLFVVSIAVGCKPSDRDLVEKANSEALNQRGQLAKYLYLQVIQERTRRDEVRLKALDGLVEVSLTQLSDYSTALTALEKIIDEYENEPYFKGRIPGYRFKAAKIYRTNMQRPDKAFEIINPVLKKSPPFLLEASMEQELAKIHLARRQFEEAETHFLAAFEKTKDCASLKALQLDLVQTYSLSKKCDRALEWSARPLPNSCARDDYSLAIERAHCYETTGESSKSIRIYEEMISQNPKNSRLHFKLESLRQRIREKQRR